MNTEKIKLTQVHINEKNPRTISTDKFQKLVDSILVFPKMLELRPIVIDRLYQALGGNMRTRALNYIAGLTPEGIRQRLSGIADYQKMGEGEQAALVSYWEEWLGDPIAVIVRADTLTEAEKKQFIIKDNVAYGTWDFDMLANQFDENTLTGWGVDLMIETSDDDPRNELEKVQNDEFSEEEEEQAKQANRTSLGDIWQLGEHRLLCGDSTRVEDVKKLMGDELADLWITDPPYNVALGYNESASEARQRHRRTDCRTIMNDQMPDLEFRDFLKRAFKAAFEGMRQGAAFYIWHADNESYNFRGALRDNGVQIRETLIWNKNAITLGRQDYQWKHEPCLYGWKDGAAHYFQDSRSEPTVIQDEAELDIDKMTKEEMKKLLHSIYDENRATTVINEKKPAVSKEHPTMKPVRLFAYQIANSSKGGGIVLDTFGGSGTTIIACEQLGRKGRLVELDPHYCDVIVARWEKLTGRTAVKTNDTGEE